MKAPCYRGQSRDTVKAQSLDNPFELSCLPAEAQAALRHYDERVSASLRQAQEAIIPGAWENHRALPKAFLTHLERAFLVYDQSLRFVQSHLRRAGWTVTCAPGCHYCCTQLPSGLTGAEILYLYDGASGAGILDRMFRRSMERMEMWGEICRWDRDPSGEASLDQRVAGRLSRYHTLNVPCPFLHAGLCSLYRQRPLACRIHFSLSPPHWCRPEHFQHANAVRFNVEPSTPVMDALQRLDETLGLELSDVLVCGFVEFAVNVMGFRPVQWIGNPH